MYDARELMSTAVAQGAMTCAKAGEEWSLECVLKPEKFDVSETSTLIFLEVAVIILVCRFVGLVFKNLTLPSVIGEIIAGILLGPSGMGQANPDVDPAHPNPQNPTSVLFPMYEKYGPSNTRNYLNVLAQLGVVVFMFVVGLEVDIPKLKKTSSMAAVIAISSVALPFVLGAFWLAPDLHKRHSEICPTGVAPGSKDCKPVLLLPFQLFVGVSMSVTAFPVLARIITEKGLQKLQLGSTTLACAALNDVVAWALLTICLAVNSGGGYTSVPKMIGLIIAVGIGEFFIVGPLMRITAFNHFKRVGHLSPNRLAWIMVGMLLSAWIVHYVGFHAMLGAFLFGLVFPRGHGTPFLYTILQRVEAFATLLLLPIFFLVTGLSIDLTKLKGRAGLDFIYILITACAGKFFGSCIPAKLYKMNWRHTFGIGVMMNTRGLTEVVVLNIAKDANIIDEQMFSALVLMAVITTAMAGPMLSVVFPAKQLVIEKQLDIQAAAASKGKTLDAHVARIAVLVHNVPDHPKLLESAISTLTSPYLKAHLDIAQFLRPSNVHAPTELGTGNLYSPEEVGNRKALKEGVSKIRRKYLTSTVAVRVTHDTLGEMLMHIKAAAPQLVVTDWPATEEERQQLKAAVVDSPCTVMLWGGPHPTANITAAPLPAGTQSAMPSLRPSMDGNDDTRSRPVSRRSITPQGEDTRGGMLVARGAAAAMAQQVAQKLESAIKTDSNGHNGHISPRNSERPAHHSSLPTIASNVELTQLGDVVVTPEKNADASQRSNGLGNGNGKAHGHPDSSMSGGEDAHSEAAAASARHARTRQWSVSKLPPNESKFVAFKRILVDDKYQDQVAEAVLEDVWAVAEMLRERMPGYRGEQFEHRERERDRVAKEQAELMAGTHGGDGGDGGEATPVNGSPPAAGGRKSGTATPELAVHVPQSASPALAPVFSKLMVCGWPASEEECAALIRFLYDVEFELKRKNASAQEANKRSLQPSLTMADSRAGSARESVGPSELATVSIPEMDSSGMPQSKVVLMMDANPVLPDDGAELVPPSGNSMPGLPAPTGQPMGPLRTKSFVLGANQTARATESVDLGMAANITLSALNADGGMSVMTTARLGLVAPGMQQPLEAADHELHAEADDVCVNLDNTLTVESGKQLADAIKASLAASRQETIPE